MTLRRGGPSLVEQAEAAMMLCEVCGSRAVVLRGSLSRPTHTECTYCGARDCAKPGAPPLPTPAARDLPSHVAGGVMLSAIERGDYGRMFGLDALEALLGRGPEDSAPPLPDIEVDYS